MTFDKLRLRLQRHALPHAIFAAFAFAVLAFTHALFLEQQFWLPGFLGASVAWVAFSARSSFNGSAAIMGSLLIASAIGIASSRLDLPLSLIVIIACSLSIFITSLLDCEYPPSGAAAVITASGHYDWWYLLSPVASGALIMILMRYLWLKIDFGHEN